MDRLGMEEDIPIENKMISKAVENAQKKVEGHNFDIRKHLIEYDDVMNNQRTEIYSYRREILKGEELKERIQQMIEDTVDELLFIYCPEEKHSEEWDIKGLTDAVYGIFSLTIKQIPSDQPIRDFLLSEIRSLYEAKERDIGSEVIRYLEKMILLQIVDAQWKDHLLGMDHLKEGIGLRGYGQRDPLVEYKKEAFEVFADMTGRIATETLSRLFKVQFREEKAITRTSEKQKLIYNRG
jgi:preprotein translocase subunit SecA